MGIPGKKNAQFLSIAESLIPKLRVTDEKPLATIDVEKDESALLGWGAIGHSVEEGEKKVLNGGDKVIFDFGGHRAATLTFHISAHQHTVEPADSPARMKIVFGEVLNDVAEGFEDYKAWVSASWLPDEIINVDHLPATITMPRRHAFRYVSFTAISTSPRFGVQISEVVAHSVTSAPVEDPPELTFGSAASVNGAEMSKGLKLDDGQKEMLRKIDKGALLTLRNCMQTVYEDGPRRDMRLWIGDLRLQALCSYATFKDYDLAKRCLYLFAAMPFNDEGMLAACVYEKLEPKSGGNSIVDYAMLFSASLLEYVVASGDLQTGHDLFETALKQFTFFFKYLGGDLAYNIPESASGGGGEGWHFIDWEPTLEKASSEHAIMIYCLKSVLDLSKRLSLPEPSLHFDPTKSTSGLSSIISQMETAHRKHYFNSSTGMFQSGKKAQASWASCAWAVIAGIPESKEEAQRALRTVYEDEGAVKGMTPYLHHYLCEAFVAAGLEDLAVKHILEYWGSMITAGGSTFFEAWDPKNPRVSPYGDLHSNSFCHAWSCTPALLLRQLGFT